MIVIPRHTSFADWPAEKNKHGLQILSWDTAQFPPVALIVSTRGEEIRFSNELVEAPMKNQPIGADAVRPQSQSAKTGYLARLLADLHAKAWKQPGKPQRAQLRGGLRIDLIIGLDGMTRILLARQGVYPSDTEWSVTLANFPYDPPLDAEPERFIHQSWHCLRAEWKTPNVLSEGE